MNEPKHDHFSVSDDSQNDSRNQQDTSSPHKKRNQGQSMEPPMMENLQKGSTSSCEARVKN